MFSCFAEGYNIQTHRSFFTLLDILLSDRIVLLNVVPPLISSVITLVRPQETNEVGLPYHLICEMLGQECTEANDTFFEEFTTPASPSLKRRTLIRLGTISSGKRSHTKQLMLRDRGFQETHIAPRARR
jgi:hypothetical protein